MNPIPASHRRATRDTLLASVAAIRDTLAEQCEAEEQQATLSTTTVEALHSAGIFGMKLPAVLGGSEADPVTQFEVIDAIAAINASAGWCTMVGATSLGLLGAFLPDAGIARMFVGGRIPRGAIVVMPGGEARLDAGGYRLNGHWAFASGVRHAEWIVVCARVIRDESAAPEIFLMVLPASEVTIQDNWQVAGLKGTGSCDITITDRVVPECMAWNMLSAPPQRGGALYRLRPARVRCQRARGLRTRRSAALARYLSRERNCEEARIRAGRAESSHAFNRTTHDRTQRDASTCRACARH